MTPSELFTNAVAAGEAERGRWMCGFNSRIPTYFAEAMDDEFEKQFLAPNQAACQSFIAAQGYRAFCRYLAEALNKDRDMQLRCPRCDTVGSASLLFATLAGGET